MGRPHPTCWWPELNRRWACLSLCSSWDRSLALLWTQTRTGIYTAASLLLKSLDSFYTVGCLESLVCRSGLQSLDFSASASIYGACDIPLPRWVINGCMWSLFQVKRIHNAYWFYEFWSQHISFYGVLLWPKKLLVLREPRIGENSPTVQAWELLCGGTHNVADSMVLGMSVADRDTVWSLW